MRRAVIKSGAGLLVVLLVGCSAQEGSGVFNLPNPVRVLPGGKQCEVQSKTISCEAVAAFLRSSLRLGRLDPITVVALAEDGSALHQLEVANRLRSAGYWRVGIAKIGFIREAAQGPRG